MFFVAALARLHRKLIGEVSHVPLSRTRAMLMAWAALLLVANPTRQAHGARFVAPPERRAPPPIISITFSPNGGTVTGATLTAYVDACSNAGISYVDLYVNGSYRATGYGSGGECASAATTATLTPGWNTLSAYACDFDGYCRSNAVDIYYDAPPPPAQPPSVSVSPGNSTVSSPTISVSAQGCDSNSPIASLTLAVNGSAVGSPSGIGSSCANASGTATLSAGANSVSATACNQAGACATGSSSVTYDYTAPPTVPATYGVRVRPAVASRDVAPGKNQALVFTVSDSTTGTADSVAVSVTVSCSGYAAASPCVAAPTQFKLGRSGQQEVSVAFDATGADSLGVVKIVARVNGDPTNADSGRFNIRRTTSGSAGGGTSPYVVVGTHRQNPEGAIAREQCLAIAAGPAASYECGDLRVVHALPATTSMNTTRIPTLIYNSGLAKPVVRLAAEVDVGNLSTSPSAIDLTLRIAGLEITRNVPWNTQCATTSCRVAIQVDARANNLTTAANPAAAYKYTLEVKVPTGGTPLVAMDSGVVAIVDRGTSPFGAGWWLDGYERLVPVPSDTTLQLWVGGDGSTRLYRRAGASNVWLAERLTRPDTLMRSGLEWWRLLPNGARVTFDNMGRHLNTRTFRGHTTSFSRDAGGALTEIVLPARNTASSPKYTLKYRRDANQAPLALDSIYAPLARNLRIAGSGSSVDSIGDPEGKFTRFGYAGGLMTRRTDRTGAVQAFRYDAAGALRADSLVMTGYGAPIVNQFCAAETRSLASCHLDPAVGLIPLASFVTLVDGPRDTTDVTRFHVGRFGQPDTVVNALGHRTIIERGDSTFALLATAVVDPTGFRVEAAYNRRGLIVGSTQVAPLAPEVVGNAVTRYEWDPKWNAVSRIVNPLGDSTVFCVDPTTGLRTCQQPGALTNRRVIYSYDANTRLTIGVAEPNGTGGQKPADTILYDELALGNARGTRSPMGFLSYRFRDAAGRDTLIITPTDSATAKDSTSLRLNGTYQWITYDKNDRVRTTLTRGHKNGVAGMALSVTNTYDDEGRLLRTAQRSIPDPTQVDSVARAFTYDPAGRKRSEGFVGRGLRDWSYDLAGNVTKDGRGFATQDYDLINRMWRRVGDQQSTYEYDEAGRLIVAVNPFARVERTYYPNGALRSDTLRIATSDSVPVIGTNHVYGMAYHYNRDGRVTAIDHPENLRPATSSQDGTTYNYDPVTGELVDVVDVFGVTFRHRYDVSGRLQSLTRRFARSDSVSEVAAYDDDSRMVTRMQRTPTDTLHQDFLSYDGRGKIVGRSGSGGIDWVHYDGLGQVVESQFATVQGAKDHFTLDAMGNQAWHEQTGGRTPGEEWNVFAPGSARLDYTTRPSSAVQYPDTTYYEHDEVWGNRQRSLTVSTRYDWGLGSRIYVERDQSDWYDAENRLRSVRLRVDTVNIQPTHPSYVATESYRYDALGRRIWRWTHKPDPACSQVEPSVGCRSTVTRFVWAGDDLLYEIRASEAQPESDSPPSTLGPHFGVVGYTHAGSIDQPLGIFKGSEQILPLTDYRGRFDLGMCGTSRCTGDHVYFPGSDATLYGRFSRANGPPSWYGSLIEGHQDGSGYQYRRNRYLDPATGRFTQEDPIGLAGGINLYGFADGDPVNYSDPFGLCPEPASCALVLAAGAGNLALAAVNAVATKALTVAASGAAYTVYRSITAGKAYVGITNDISRRAAEHRRGLGIEIEPVLGNLSKRDARAVEQVMIEARGLKKNGGDLLNQINSISPKREDYEALIAKGRQIMEALKLDPKQQ